MALPEFETKGVVEPNVVDELVPNVVALLGVVPKILGEVVAALKAAVEGCPKTELDVV